MREEAMELEKMQREAAGVLQREMANLTSLLMQMQVRVGTGEPFVVWIGKLCVLGVYQGGRI